ncbi:TonB-dependent receptor [Dasania marina]|uniref:TonB-dependent receptor n=1 Tax=Dasania marina TaxID=471499 RepID=UPI00035DC37F|nr:TonB-dependent receptor [Dasania marina]
MSSKKQFQKNALASAIVAAAVLSGHTAPVLAAGVMEEVMVTATARKQSVQDIPYNISAMQGAELAAQNINSEADLLRSMSGVSVVDRGYRNSGTVNSIIIRGLNVDSGANGDISLNAVPTVSTYVDNTPLYANFVLKDIERVEVLRGPQGTLYGSGALGGTVRYISNKPNPEAFEAQVNGDFSQTDGSDGNNINVDFMLNVPLSEKAAIRASVGKIDNDGVVDYINAYQLNEFGEPLVAVGDNCVSPRTATDAQVLNNGACYKNEKDADDVDIDYAKVALSFEPSDNLRFLLSYQTQEDEIGARRAVTSGNNGQPVGSALRFDYGEYDSGQVLLEPSSREVDLLSLDIEVDFGFATLTSNTSSYDHEGKADSDNGGLWVSGGRDWITNFGYGGWPRPAQRAERGYEDETTIQEFRLVSNDSDSAFDWLAGVFYLDQDLTVFQNSWNPGMNEFAQSCVTSGSDVCPSFWPSTFYPGATLTERDLEYRRDVSFEELAVYGELTYHITDRLHITGGLRWFDNESVNDTIMGFPLVEGWVSSEVPQAKQKEDDVLKKFNIAYDLNDNTMIYGTYSEGFRHGGANAIPSLDNGDNFGEPNSDAINFYEKDSVENYELGIKGQTDSLNYTVSVFYVDWQDPQLNATSSWYGFYMAVNGESAATQGIEIELEGYLTETLHYRLGYTYVNAELTDDFINPQTDAVIAEDGATLPGTPESVLSVSLDNTWGLTEGLDLVARVNAYYQSESENFIDDKSALGATHDGFMLWNASATVVADNWTLSLYGKNLGNEEGVTGSFPEAYFGADTGVFENWYGNSNRQMISQPRTIGVSASYKF